MRGQIIFPFSVSIVTPEKLWGARGCYPFTFFFLTNFPIGYSFFQLSWGIFKKYNHKVFKVSIIMIWYSCIGRGKLIHTSYYSPFLVRICFTQQILIVQYCVINYSHHFLHNSSDLIHLITENLYPFTNAFLFPPPPNPWQPLFYSVFMIWLFFQIPHIYGAPCSICLSLSGLFNLT